MVANIISTNQRIKWNHSDGFWTGRWYVSSRPGSIWLYFCYMHSQRWTRSHVLWTDSLTHLRLFTSSFLAHSTSETGGPTLAAAIFYFFFGSSLFWGANNYSQQQGWIFWIQTYESCDAASDVWQPIRLQIHWWACTIFRKPAVSVLHQGTKWWRRCCCFGEGKK